MAGGAELYLITNGKSGDFQNLRQPEKLVPQGRKTSDVHHPKNVETMSEIDKKPEATPEATPAVNPPAPEAKPEEKKEKTIAEAIGEETKPDAKVVPEAAFLEEKKGRKEVERENKELKRQLEEALASGGTGTEIASDIEAIGKKHNVDPGFLRDLTSTLETRLKRDTSETVSKILKPIEEGNRQERINKAFDTHFSQAMENMPEFKGVVNKEAIKSLSLDPRNANKTFSQIIEETYGSALPGRRTIEDTRPGGGKEPGEIDFKRAKTDSTYFKEIMSDPAQKAKYNSEMMNRIGGAL